jgi:hypothetical protein
MSFHRARPAIAFTISSRNLRRRDSNAQISAEKKCYTKMLQSDILRFDQIAQIPVVEGGEVVRDRGFEPLTPTVSR